jgi:hypothetical protein
MTAVRSAAPAEEWDYLDVDVLCPARSGAVCITCQHFRYEVGRHCVTVLDLNASRNPEQSPRVRMLLGDFLADIQDCEGELGIYASLDT